VRVVVCGGRATLACTAHSTAAVIDVIEDQVPDPNGLKEGLRNRAGAELFVTSGQGA
jgi:hypothetical protein